MKKLRKNLITGVFLIFALSIILFISLAFYIGIKVDNDTKIRSDVIVVLGARSYIDGKYNPCLKARVEHAVELYKSKYASKILMTGGNDKEDNVNEAETMKKIATNHGVPSGDILLEKSSTSTYENLLNSQKILKSNHLNSVIIVTEPFHAARSALVAEKLDLNFTVSPTSTSPCWQPWKYFSYYFLKEPFVVILYKIQNKL